MFFIVPINFCGAFCLCELMSYDHVGMKKVGSEIRLLCHQFHHPALSARTLGCKR
jgi:hypothetical protein